MKKTAIILAVCLLCLLLPGCREQNTGQFVTRVMNSPWEFGGGSITVTGVTVTDSCLVPDGTTYSQDDDVLVIVRLKADLNPEWSISAIHLTTYFHTNNSKGTLLCDPIPEVSDSGEEVLLYLFSIPKVEYTGRIRYYFLDVSVVESGGTRRAETFNFYPYVT